MPHKRSKRSKRELERKQKGTDLPPVDDLAGGTPKLATWVLGAEKVRTEYRERKRKQRKVGGSRVKRRDEHDNAEPNAVSSLDIQAGESLGAFNRRVEEKFKGGLRKAFLKSKNRAPVSKKEAISSGPTKSAESETQQTPKSKAAHSPSTAPSLPPRKAEFDALPKTTRLNDVVTAPPALKPATRKAPDRSNAARDVLSLRQKQDLEEEREKVIRRYREMKEAKRVEAESRKAPVPQETRRLDDS